MQSKSLPGASRNKEIYKALIESEERKHNENGEFKESVDMSDSGITAVSMAACQNTQIMSIEDDDFPSEDEKVGS